MCRLWRLWFVSASSGPRRLPGRIRGKISGAGDVRGKKEKGKRRWTGGGGKEEGKKKRERKKIEKENRKEMNRGKDCQNLQID